VDLPRQRGLRDVQDFRCAGEAAQLGDLDEVAQLTQGHGGIWAMSGGDATGF
jgi:hypothetical protein